MCRGVSSPRFDGNAAASMPAETRARWRGDRYRTAAGRGWSCEKIRNVIAQTAESAFVRACRRQAGRSLPEYRAARAGTGMLEACATPDLVTEITLQPVRRYGVDAAILFSDIVVPLRAVGVGVDIRPGVGPVVDQPIRLQADVQ